MRGICVSILTLLFAVDVMAWRPWPLPMDSVDDGCDVHRYHGRMDAWASIGRTSPFWFSSGRGGVVGVRPSGVVLDVGMAKEASRPARWWDYSYGLSLVGRADGQGVHGMVSEANAHVRLWCFDFTAGFVPFDYGNQHKLSAGGLLFSKNAPSIPMVEVGIGEYTAFPFSYGYVEVKGGISQGWFLNKDGARNTMLHYKFAGVRLGGRLPVRLSYEFHHAAQWGGVSEFFGELGGSLADFKQIFLAGAGGVVSGEQINAYGNHIGSQMVGLEVDIKREYRLSLYWQNLFEDGPIMIIGRTMNASDGLWGVGFDQGRWPFIKSVLYEFVNTTDQSGPRHDMDGLVFGGCDDYFWHSIYRQGWTNRGFVLGTPFITSPVKEGGDMVTNNRVMAHHFAVGGEVKEFQYLLRVSHVENYGRYKQSMRSGNTALYLHLQKTVRKMWGMRLRLSLAADFGTQFGDNYGLMLSLIKIGMFK